LTVAFCAAAEKAHEITSDPATARMLCSLMSGLYRNPGGISLSKWRSRFYDFNIRIAPMNQNEDKWRKNQTLRPLEKSRGVGDASSTPKAATARFRFVPTRRQR
jgi:hypothetical protein